VANPIKGIKELTKTHRAILNYIAHAEAQFKTLYMSQSTIAKFVGCTRQYVNQCIRDLVELGLLNKKYQAYLTCNYKLSGFLKLRPVIVLLKPYIPNLKYFYSTGMLCLSMLMSGSNGISAKAEVDTIGSPSSDFILRLTKLNLLRNYASTTGARETSINEEVKKVYPVFEESDRSKSRGLLKSELSVRKRSEEKRNGVVRSGISKKGDDVQSTDVFVYGTKKLTTHGVIELTCFPEEVVAAAYRELCARDGNAVRDALAYLYGTCEKMCRAKNIEIDYARKKYLKKIAETLENREHWVDANPDEIAAHAQFKLKLNKQKEPIREKSNSNSGKEWKGHYNENDQLVTIRHTPEEVRANAETLEKNLLVLSLAGISPREMFKREMVEGKEYQRSAKELELQKKRQASYPAYSKSQPESITLKEKRESNTNAREYVQTLNQIDFW
jgi:DNA-binding Lrp family transcriptional regulator